MFVEKDCKEIAGTVDWYHEQDSYHAVHYVSASIDSTLCKNLTGVAPLACSICLHEKELPE